jgi:hypothetical protein
MQDLLIDERGRKWPADHPFLAEQFGSRAADRDFAAYAVWQLGYAYLRPHGMDMIVAFRPRLICPATMVGIFYEMHRQRPRQVFPTASAETPGRALPTLPMPHSASSSL